MKEKGMNVSSVRLEEGRQSELNPIFGILSPVGNSPRERGWWNGNQANGTGTTGHSGDANSGQSFTT